MAEPQAPDVDDDTELPAGDYSSWLDEMRAALRGERSADVACGTCTACCTAAQFVHIGPDEADTLAHIPKELRFPAPGLPSGHIVLGYDERGHCAMLVDGKCTIYEHRPRTCRTYDCRIFAAAGIGELDKPLIAQRVRRWRFSFDSEAAHRDHEALRAAAAYLQSHQDVLGGIAMNPTQLAVFAFEIQDMFVGRDEATGATMVVEPAAEAVRAAVARWVRSRMRAAPGIHPEPG